MGVRELVGDANGVPASEKVKKHWCRQCKFSIYENVAKLPRGEVTGNRLNNVITKST